MGQVDDVGGGKVGIGVYVGFAKGLIIFTNFERFNI